MVDKIIKQSPIFGEFTPEESNYWFNLSKEKVCAHVDTLYYTVSVYDDSNDCSEEMRALLNELAWYKSQKVFNSSAQVEFFGLNVEKTRFVHYEYCLRLEEQFDIFVSSILPNEYTPRIVVQLRSRMLVLDGVEEAIRKSFAYVEDILFAYGLSVLEVKENRIDYAYHTNLIQNPYKFFKDDFLLKKLKSKLRIYHKVGDIGKKIDIDYISFGHRNSNDIFVRIYNKSREVVEKNYKLFFVDKWLQDKLISQYDHYCYSRAFEMNSYVTGLLVGRIEWYLENGHNDDIKAELSKTEVSSYIKSDNTDQLRKIVDKYLPPVTLIMNIEYQTKRKFYFSLDEWISSYALSKENGDGKREFLPDSAEPLVRLLVINILRSEICNYLTSQTLCFVENKGKKNEKFSRWWERINQCYIEEYDKRIIDLWRSYEQNTNLDKSKRSLCGKVAAVSILNNRGLTKSTFLEDVSDALCALNDNDFYGFACNPETGEAPALEPKFYQDLKIRKYRQQKNIIQREDKQLKNEKDGKKE